MGILQKLQEKTKKAKEQVKRIVATSVKASSDYNKRIINAQQQDVNTLSPTRFGLLSEFGTQKKLPRPIQRFAEQPFKARKVSDTEFGRKNPTVAKVSDVLSAPGRTITEGLVNTTRSFLFGDLEVQRQADAIKRRAMNGEKVSKEELTFLKKLQTDTGISLAGSVEPVKDVSGGKLKVEGAKLLRGLSDKAEQFLKKGDEVAARKVYSDIFNEVDSLVTSNLPKKTIVSNLMEVRDRLPTAIKKDIEGVIDGLKKELTPIERVTLALEDATPARKEQEKLYTAERSRRISEVKEVGEEIGGEEGYYAQLRKMKGQLPKVDFESIRKDLKEEDIKDLFNTIQKSDITNEYNKIKTKGALAKLLDGGLPTEGELKLLKDVFPEEFIDTIVAKQPLLQKIKTTVHDLINVPKSMLASIDYSGPLRQGAFFVGRPKQFLPAFREMFKYSFDEKAYKGLIDDIKARPNYSRMADSNLALTDVGGSLSVREESFMSNIAEKLFDLPKKIPGIGKFAGNPIKAGSRAYSGFLNKLRADVFDDLVGKAEKQGVEVTQSFLDDLSKFINSATGRGHLGALESSALALNNVFFSPRLIASRLHLLNPTYYVDPRVNPFVRKEALKSLFTFAGMGLSVLGLAKLAGADVGVDPRSADFGKIKVGNTRYDIWGGFQQYIVLAARLLTGESVSSTSGKTTELGKGYKPETRASIIARQAEYKLSPAASFALSLLRKSDVFGQDAEIPKEVQDRFVPLTAQTMQELQAEWGPMGFAMGIPAIFGVGVQTYDAKGRPKKKKPKGSINKPKTASPLAK